MSDAVIWSDDFHPVYPLPPSMRSIRPQQNSRVVAEVGDGPTTGAANPPPTYNSAQHQRASPLPSSPAVLTKRPREKRVEELYSAFNEAYLLADAMVAEEEGDPLDDQTVAYAVQVLAPLIATMEIPSALVLPLQSGGISVEWHEVGLNIELRFRKPFEIYAVLEDARGAIPAHHGRDPHLVQTRDALRELRDRSLA